MKLISNVHESNASLTLQRGSGCTVHEPVRMYVCVCREGVRCDMCWRMDDCDKGLGEGSQSNTSKRESKESRVEKPCLKVISRSLSLSVCMLPRDKVN